MDILIDLREQTLSSIASDGVFYSQTETEIKLVTQNGEQSDFNGVSCALLAPDGITLAHSIASANKAVLDTDTEECVKFVEGASIDSEKVAFLAIGDSDKPLAILPVAIKRNPLSNIAPPTALAPSYPTSESLLAILAQMTAQANRAEEAVEATETAREAIVEYVDNVFPSKVTEAEERLENATDEAVRKIDNEAQDATSTISRQGTAIVYSLSEAQKTILGNIGSKANEVNTALDTKLASANTAIDSKVEQANQAKTDAVKAKDDAETAKGQAEGFATQASKSAEQASKSAEQAEQAKNAIGDVGGRLDSVEVGIEKALPYSLKNYDYNVQAWLGQEESNILTIGGIVPAPVGFIATHGTKNPYAKREVVWIKPNGERITILTSAKNLAEHPWLNYNNTTPRTMWLDGDYVYIVTTSNSVTYKTSIHFINGEPKDIVSVSVADADLTCNVSYSIKIADNFVIANNGEIFNAETLKVVSTVTLATDRLVTASNAQGVYAMTSQGVVLITVDESGSPIITVKNSSKKYLPLANGKFVKGNFYSTKVWAKMFACEGGLSNSITDSIAGNVVPAVMNADIGNFVVNPFALYQVCSCGTSFGAVGYTMPIVRFPRCPWIYENGSSLFAVKSGDAILINLIYNYILITKEALV
jgi:hypothetical protein